MRILIAAAAFSAEMSGVQRHAFNMAQALLRREEIQAVYLVVAPWQRRLAEDFARNADSKLTVCEVAMGNSAIARNVWYYRKLPELARMLDVMIVHLAYPVPVNARAFPCPVAVTLHDLYPCEIPENFGFPKSLVNRRILHQCMNTVDGIACVSETTRERMREYLSARICNKAVCIPNCVLPMPQAIKPGAAALHGEPFLLCMAQHRRNKNIPLLLRGFAQLVRERRIDVQMRLLVVGIDGPETRWIHHVAVEHKLNESVRFLSGLSEAELHWCYANCEALVAPSSTEGFGLPVAEGLLAGCRVVCSEIGAHREIGSEHCHFVDLHGDAENALAEGIVSALDTPRPVAVSFPQLSMDAVGTQYLRFHRRLIEARSVESRSGLRVATRGV